MIVNNKSDLISNAELAKLLGIHRNSINTKIDKENITLWFKNYGLGITGKKIGRGYYWQKEDVLNLLVAKERWKHKERKYYKLKSVSFGFRTFGT